MTHEFVTDMSLPDMLHCITVRARFPRGRVLGIRTPELPREIRLVTAADIPGSNRVTVGDTTLPLLADDYVSYHGEPVALLVGPELEDLAVLVEDIELDYEREEPVFEPDADDIDHRAAHRELSRGDTSGELANAYQVVQGEYRTGPQEHMYSEPLAAVAGWEDGLLAIYTATQWIHHVHRTCRTVLGGGHRIAVRATALGEHLDGKLWHPSLVAARAALAAHVTGRSVRLSYSAPEDFLYSSKRAPMFASYSAGLDAEGNLQCLQIRLVFNLGAYPMFAREIVDRATHAATGDYRCAHVTVRTTALQSNLPPLNAHVGLATSQVLFALESHVARIAELAQVPPDAWKRANLLTRGDRSINGITLPRSVDAARLLEDVVGRSDFSRKHAAYELQKKRRTDFEALENPSRGIGLAFASQGSGFIGAGESEYASKVRVRLETDGSVHLRCPAMNTDRPLARYWRSMAAEILAVAPNHVTFDPIDSTVIPDTGPLFLSRHVAVITRTVESCCNAVAKKRFRTSLPIEATRSYRLPRSQRWNGETFRGRPFVEQAYGTAVVEVDVDPMTLAVRVRAIWMSIDGGHIIDRAAAEQSTERGIFQALGWAASEQIEYTEGTIRVGDYERYGPDARAQNPTLSIAFPQVDPKDPPRGIGELAFSCVPAAYAAAVSQATGNYLDRLPVTPAVLDAYLETS
ncbi:MAG: molybdopterin-dependent oxidoreductase [Spirochaetes bacterium]|nr:molybdopterin-dependent oxidoreductase [Spirochaetota bacterium]